MAVRHFPHHRAAQGGTDEIDAVQVDRLTLGQPPDERVHGVDIAHHPGELVIPIQSIRALREQNITVLPVQIMRHRQIFQILEDVILPHSARAVKVDHQRLLFAARRLAEPVREDHTVLPIDIFIGFIPDGGDFLRADLRLCAAFQPQF